MKENQRRRKIQIRTLLFIIAGVLLYAYAFQVTDVNLEEPLEPQRQENLIGLLREMARPDFLDYDEELRSTNLSIRMPCPEVARASQITSEGRFVVFSPNCATTTQDVLTITGEGFASNVQGIIRWYPATDDPDTVTTSRTLTPFRADTQGNFTVSFTMPDIRETEETQRIEVVEVVGRTVEGFSETSKITVERIIETILMALMASTVGTVLAVPISFLAARNLMEHVNMPLASISAALLLLPFGGFIGWWLAALVGGTAGQLTQNSLFGIIILVIVGAVIPLALRLWSSLTAREQSDSADLVIKIVLLFSILLLTIFGLGILSNLGASAGQKLDQSLGIFGFLGNFIFVLSDLTRVLLPLTVGFIGALTAATLASSYTQETVLRVNERNGRLITFFVTLLGFSTLFLILLYAFNWICLFGMCRQLPQEQGALLEFLLIPSVIFGLIIGGISSLRPPKHPVPIGFIIYTLSRSSLNLLRAIEPLIMGAVFVVWVGIGPFAGILALILNSIADLGKLFSEQVENIEDGPLEAITATGANRLQMIVFAVIPQITLHYIAFAFYRWDINVRLSTIIGFIGGGGIGLVLQRAANLTQYSQASVMIIAIAVVVTVLDYVSSQIRSRII